MANITYNPQEGDPQEVKAFGKMFKAGESVEVSDPLALLKAQNNPFFEVSANKEEQKQAQVVGGFQDANSGDEIQLVRRPRLPSYTTPDLGVTGPTPPSSATQGSTAAGNAPSTNPVAPGNFEDVYGASVEQHRTGEYEGAPEYKGPQGTEGAAKRGPGRPPKQRAE